MQIKVYHNVETDFLHPYQAGMRLEMVDCFEAREMGEVSAESKIEDILERVYRIHNAVDGTERNVALNVRSLSLGDVVEVDGKRYAVAMFGFKPVASTSSNEPAWWAALRVGEGR